MTSDGGVTITWLGHATTTIEFDGKVVLIDPWLQTNPAVPEDKKDVGQVDVMLITHGHSDHIADAVPVAERTHPHVICNVEIAQYLKSKGVENVTDMNKGGTVDADGLRVTMVDAVHSSGITEGDHVIDGGSPTGFVLRFPNDFTVYHSGDTDLFESMHLIGRRYRPDVVMLPIGGHYTMDPSAAAEALRMLGATTIIPIHYGTFPLLAGTPDDLEREASDIAGLKVVALRPGESVTQQELA